MYLTRIIRNGKRVTLLEDKDGRPIESWSMKQQSKNDFWDNWYDRMVKRWGTTTWWNH